MKPFTLTYDPKDNTGNYAHGYWYAYSEATDAEGEGVDPLAAVSDLALSLERLLVEARKP